MLPSNLKALRKSRGLTQEEFASQLHVVRQTVSKWESGQSVPDAALLVWISEIMEVPVADLLGDTLPPSEEQNDARVLAEKLSVVTAQLARAAERRRLFWRIVSVAALVLALVFAVWAAWSSLSLRGLAPMSESQIIGQADGPTSVFVTVRVYPVGIAVMLLLLILSIIGIVLTGRDR